MYYNTQRYTHAHTLSYRGNDVLHSSSVFLRPNPSSHVFENARASTNSITNYIPYLILNKQCVKNIFELSKKTLILAPVLVA